MLEDKNKQVTNLEELGEFGLIDRLTSNIKIKNTSTLKGIGDDAAVIESGNGVKVISTDMLVEGVHFDVTYMPLKHLGYKAVMVNLSDIYAMNAIPEQITVSIAVSSRYSIEALEEIYTGIKTACDFYKVDLVGGDTTSSLAGLMISITAVGSAPHDKVVYRSGAKEHDLICMSGDIGGAYMGLQVLEREKSVFKEHPDMQPDLAGYDYVLERQLKPEARHDVIKALGEFGVVPTSMIDISDPAIPTVVKFVNNSCISFFVVMIFDENFNLTSICQVLTIKRITRKGRFRQLKEPIRMFDQPGRVYSHMIGNHITGDPDTVMSSFMLQIDHCLFSTQLISNAVIGERIGGSNNICITRKVFYGLGGMTSLPYTNEPESGKSTLS